MINIYNAFTISWMIKMEKGVSNGPITKWIERYYEEKLDKREKRGGPGAYLGMAKKKRMDLLTQQLYLN